MQHFMFEQINLRTYTNSLSLIPTVPLNCNFIFARTFLCGATTQVHVDHVPCSMEYTCLMCAMHVTCMDIPHV